MIEMTFEYRKSGYFSISIKDKQYRAIERISNFNWTSDRVAEDIAWTKLCKEGTFKDEDGETDFYVGFEGSPGIICVGNGEETAELYDAYDSDKPPYLSLTLDELLDVLQQMYDYLKSVGK